MREAYAVMILTICAVVFVGLGIACACFSAGAATIGLAIMYGVAAHICGICAGAALVVTSVIIYNNN